MFGVEICGTFGLGLKKGRKNFFHRPLFQVSKNGTACSHFYNGRASL
jgi:hypothetical protein